MLHLTLTCWIALASAGAPEAQGDDTAALIACERAVEKREASLTAARDALKKANDAAALERAAADEREQLLKAALLERDEAEDGARRKATVATVTGIASTAVEAVALVVLLSGGSKTLAAGLAAAGATGQGVSLAIAVW